MTQSSITELERDIEESRARLDHTIVRLQDRLSVSGIVDDMLGSARGQVRLNEAYDNVLTVIRQNPIPVILIATGVGLLLHSMARGPRGSGVRQPALRTVTPYEADVPVLSTGNARVYDPDTSPRNPTQDTLESRRDLNARA